jgi:hypothetical protein
MENKGGGFGCCVTMAIKTLSIAIKLRQLKSITIQQ